MLRRFTWDNNNWTSWSKYEGKYCCDDRTEYDLWMCINNGVANIKKCGMHDGDVSQPHVLLRGNRAYLCSESLCPTPSCSFILIRKSFSPFSICFYAVGRLLVKAGLERQVGFELCSGHHRPRRSLRGGRLLAEAGFVAYRHAVCAKYILYTFRVDTAPLLCEELFIICCPSYQMGRSGPPLFRIRCASEQHSFSAKIAGSAEVLEPENPEGGS